ncbi:YgjV family protein [Candidatus Gracilibacteria bacterium]|nr:YgjV family protein [Candidatus Gracilibacteria bacterium]
MLHILDPFWNGFIITFLENPLGQILGFTAMLIGITGFIVQEDRVTIKIFIVSTIFWLLHFLFLANWGAFGATIIGLTRLVLSLKYQKSWRVLSGVVCASILFGMISFDGKLLSILPLIATAVSSYGFFFLQKIQLRLLLGVVSCMWFTYHLQTGSLSGVINEIIVLCTIVYSIYLFITRRERKILLKERINFLFGKIPKRINYGRYIYFRDKNRF